MEKEKTKRKFKPIGFLIIGIVILIVPSAIYLGFLIPKMQEQYIVMMASGGVIGGSGATAASFIPEDSKRGTLFKTATKAFTLLTVLTLIQDFIGPLIGVGIVFSVCYIVFLIMKGLWKDGREKERNAKLAETIKRSIIENSK